MPSHTLGSLANLDCTIVDGDFHLTEQTGDIVEYLESPWKNLLKGGDPLDETTDVYYPSPSPAVLEPHIVTERGAIFSSDAVRTKVDIREGTELLDVDIPPVDPRHRHPVSRARPPR